MQREYAWRVNVWLCRNRAYARWQAGRSIADLLPVMRWLSFDMFDLEVNSTKPL